MWARSCRASTRPSDASGRRAFAFGVVKKFGDDRGGALAAELTYYGFLSIFPALLILTTVLGFVGNRSVSDSVIGTTLSRFPVIGEQIGKNVDHPLSGSGLGLAFGLVILLYGVLGSTQAVAARDGAGLERPRRGPPRLLPAAAPERALLRRPGRRVSAASTLLAASPPCTGQSLPTRVAGFVGVVVVNIGLYVGRVPRAHTVIGVEPDARSPARSWVASGIRSC